MLNKDPTVFHRSRDPRELVTMAKVYAASPQAEDQAILLKQLDSGEFLHRLNEELHYIALPSRQLRVAGIIKVLMQQEHPQARETLIKLTHSQAFQSYPSLVELNIIALSCDRPACPRTIAYWEKHSRPTSSTIILVMEAIFINRSQPALRLFESRMNDARYDWNFKQVWLKDQYLRARNDPQVLAFTENILKAKTLDARWHSPILEALFDYNEGWYISCKFPRPPARQSATPPARATLGRIGEHALKDMQLFIPGLRGKIMLVMKEIGHDWEKNKDQPNA